VKKYHDLLVWEITDQPKVLQWAGKVLDPLIGKSTIVYARKLPVAAVAGGAESLEEVNAA